MTSSGTFGRRATAGQDRDTLKAIIRAETYARPAAEPVADEEPRASRVPWVTIGMIALFTAIFFGEQTFAFEHGGGTISWRSTMALGGVDRQLVVAEGQWWRLFTAPLLHASVEHLVGNAVVLLFAGFGLERLIGRAWFAAIFTFGAIAGAVASISLNPPWMLSVGASGGIMALLIAAFVCSFHAEAHAYGARMRWWVYRLALPSLIPFGAANGGHVDYSCHMGGALAGFAFGYALQFLWSEDRALPPLRREAAVASAIAAGVAVVAFALTAGAYPAYARRQAVLIPDAQIPKGDADSLEASASLVALYPHDPRGHLLRAVAAAKDNDVATVESEARAGLAERDILARDFPPQVEVELRALLVLSLYAEGREDEARGQAAEVCANPDMMAGGQKLLQRFKTERLCG